MLKRKVVVVGGGAAGMMAAASAAAVGHSVTLLEKNESLGRKLLVTGNGRCNVTNEKSMEEIREHVVTNAKFLYSPFQRFTNRDMIAFLKEFGVETKVEENGRVFPVSDRAGDVLDAFVRALRRYRVNVQTKATVRRLLLEPIGPKVRGVELASGEVLVADWVVVATGGLAVAVLGSDGDGYAMAKMCGHRIVPCRPSLVPLVVNEQGLDELQGVSVSDAVLTFKLGKKKLHEARGSMLFTHFGVSGPAVLNASGYILKGLDKATGEKSVRLLIDFLPEETREETEQHILNAQKASSHRSLKHADIGTEKLPQALRTFLLVQCGLDPNREIGMLKKKERGRWVEALHSYALTITGTRGFCAAMVTSGGVSVKEVDAKTMESKKCAGLKFAGEVLDVDANTGGYNLQIAWSTGYTAGSTIV